MAVEHAEADALLQLYDPKGLIRQVMELDEPAQASARDCIVLWLMSLDDQVDPADAARHLLQALAPSVAPRTALAMELARELEEVTRFPREQLLGSRPSRGTRRRRT